MFNLRVIFYYICAYISIITKVFFYLVLCIEYIFRHASDEFMIVANSYRYSHRLTESPLYFGIVDFDEGSDIFQLVSIILCYCS